MGNKQKDEVTKKKIIKERIKLLYKQENKRPEKQAADEYLEHQIKRRKKVEARCT